jgi:hypothetical protein
MCDYVPVSVCEDLCVLALVHVLSMLGLAHTSPGSQCPS